MSKSEYLAMLQLQDARAFLTASGKLSREAGLQNTICKFTQASIVRMSFTWGSMPSNTLMQPLMSFLFEKGCLRSDGRPRYARHSPRDKRELKNRMTSCGYQILNLGYGRSDQGAFADQADKPRFGCSAPRRTR